MAFQLREVVPWGRNLREYLDMFGLTENDKKLKIAGFGDGPASFNYEATRCGYNITSFDPIYQFLREELRQRISEVREIVMKQMAENKDNYVWENIKNLEELEEVRMSAMNMFLADFERGLAEKRYVYHELPDRLNCDDDSFDLGISSHFLLMYTALGYDFHIKAMDEMMRVCKEIRIFPLVDLDANPSEMISDIIEHYRKKYEVEIRETKYEFQKGANRLLVIKR
mgnify:FL=1